jgi:hypothetical protein
LLHKLNGLLKILHDLINLGTAGLEGSSLPVTLENVQPFNIKFLANCCHPPLPLALPHGYGFQESLCKDAMGGRALPLAFLPFPPPSPSAGRLVLGSL